MLKRRVCWRLWTGCVRMGVVAYVTWPKLRRCGRDRCAKSEWMPHITRGLPRRSARGRRRGRSEGKGRTRRNGGGSGSGAGGVEAVEAMGQGVEVGSSGMVACVFFFFFFLFLCVHTLQASCFCPSRVSPGVCRCLPGQGWAAGPPHLKAPRVECRRRGSSRRRCRVWVRPFRARLS